MVGKYVVRFMYPHLYNKILCIFFFHWFCLFCFKVYRLKFWTSKNYTAPMRGLTSVVVLTDTQALLVSHFCLELFKMVFCNLKIFHFVKCAHLHPIIDYMFRFPFILIIKNILKIIFFRASNLVRMLGCNTTSCMSKV